MASKLCAPLAILFTMFIAGNADLVTGTGQILQHKDGMFHMGDADGKQIWSGLLMPRSLKLTWQNADRHCKSRNMRLISAPFSQEVKDVLSVIYHPLGYSVTENRPMFWNGAKNGNNCQYTTFRRLPTFPATSAINNPFQNCNNLISSTGAGVVCEV